jgi:hypothetical protein
MSSMLLSTEKWCSRDGLLGSVDFECVQALLLASGFRFVVLEMPMNWSLLSSLDCDPQPLNQLCRALPQYRAAIDGSCDVFCLCSQCFHVECLACRLKGLSHVFSPSKLFRGQGCFCSNLGWRRSEKNLQLAYCLLCVFKRRRNHVGRPNKRVWCCARVSMRMREDSAEGMA